MAYNPGLQHMISRGIERSLKIFNCSQNLALARFSREIYSARLLMLAIFTELLACSDSPTRICSIARNLLKRAL